MLRLMLFLLFFGVLIPLVHLYIFYRLNFYFAPSEGTKRILGWGLTLLALSVLIFVPLSRFLPREISMWLALPILSWLGVLLLTIVALVAADILWIFSHVVLSKTPENGARRDVLRQMFGLGVLGATGLLVGGAIWGGTKKAVVHALNVTLAKWPKALNGFKIVQITDLHVGPTVGGDFMRYIVDRVNAQKPDMIVITGDLVDGSVDDLRDHVAPIADLRAPHGVYFITGNHDHYSGADAWCAHVASLGIRVLRNERVSVDVGGESFDLAGVDDWHSHHMGKGSGPDLGKALAGRDPQKPVILLAHQPAAVDEAAAMGVDLQLSGHTHGGQIWPFSFLVYLQQPYIKGLHLHKGTTQIYVSPGTGFWGPPMRLGSESEITEITLSAAT